ncbi:PDZ domain-containing protein [Candidatus Microgenomates bacterium]|nr:MAG: PDZ domain-containing protein [Candidatus Microgenomates bacterium]
MRKLIILTAILIIFLGGISLLEKSASKIKDLLKTNPPVLQNEKVKVITEESVVVDAVKSVGPSVVTVAEEVPPLTQSAFPFNFGPFSIFGQQQEEQQPQGPQNIGSGFIVSSDGLIVTNKHVVSDIGGKYQIITNADKKYNVQKIYRDPLNDIAILKIDPSQNRGENLKPVVLGDSSKLQVGQFVIAIGTALGEFKNTVTTGVISGLGRGITAGDQFQGSAERLDNVIQADAAINPGNSGGPLLNSSAQVIGINTAVAQNGQNIGFAMPINVVKDSLKNFNETGQFNRPYLGVVYKIITRDLAIMNNLPEGAYVQNVVKDSPADKAKIQKGDVIVTIDNNKVSDAKEGLAGMISKKKVGDTLNVTIWRDDPSTGSGQSKKIDLKIVLEAVPSQ